jgi:hypothetical protein
MKDLINYVIRLIFVLVALAMVGCNKSNESSAKSKEQELIFEYTIAKCKELCVGSTARYDEMNCQRISKSLADMRSQGWRVVSSSQKTMKASSTECIGTEYVLER